MKKRRQHYVWRHYLTAWETAGKVWCQMGDRRFATDAINVGNERDFYRLKELSENDVSYVERIAGTPSHPLLQKLAKDWIGVFQAPFALQRAYVASGRSDREIERQLDVTINNLEEELHAAAEARSIPLLSALRDGDESIFANDDDYHHLAMFLALQYMRTPRIQRKSIEAGNMVPGFNVAAAWGVLRTIFATNIAWSIFSDRSRTKITFLQTDNTELITGDQPMVNATEARSEEGMPLHLDLYYPLSPARAVLFECDSATPGVFRRQLVAEEAMKYNRLLVAAAERQIFGASENALIASVELGASSLP
jgi:uncharacterized protein DUF4238